MESDVKKLLYIVGILVVLLIGALFALPSFIDWNDYKDELTAWSARALGRKIEISGDIRVAVLPAPALMAENVRIANVPGAAEVDMATLERVEVRVAFMPLLAGLVQVETVRLVHPVIVVERFADGSTNFEFNPAAEPAAKPASSGPAGKPDAATDDELAVRLDNFAIVDGVVMFRDAKSGRRERVEGIDAEFAAASLNGPFESFGDFVYRGTPVSYRLGVGKMVQGRTLPFDLRLDLVPGATKAEITGAVLGLDEAPKFKGDVAVSGQSLAALVAALAGADVLPALADQPFSAEAVVAFGVDALEAKKLAATVGGLKMAGTVTAAYAGPPTVTATLTAPLVDLDAMLAFEPPQRTPVERRPDSGGDSVPLPNRQADAAAGAGPAEPPGLPEGLSVTLQLAADKIAYRQNVISNARLNLDLAGGEVVISQLDALLPGGSEVFASGFLTTPEGKPTLDLAVETKIADLHRVFSWLGIPIPDVPVGRLRKAEFRSEIRATAEQVQLRKVDLAFDSTRLTGGVTVALGRSRAAFGADFKLDRLNLDAYLASRAGDAKADAGAGKPATGGPAAEKGAAKPATNGGALVEALGALRNFDANLLLSIGELTFERNLVRDVRLDSTLYRGRLDVRAASVADFAGTAAEIKGAIDKLGSLPAFDGVTVTAKVGDLARLVRAFGGDLGVRGKDAIALNFRGRADGSVLKPRLQASLATLGGSVEVNGDAYPLPGSTWFQGDVKATFPSLIALLSRFGVDYRPAGDVGGFDLAAGVAAGPKTIAVSHLAGKLDGTEIAGAVSWDTSKARPWLAVDLTTGVLRIDPFLPAKRSAALTDPGPGARPMPADWTVPAGADPWAGLIQRVALAAGIDTTRWSTAPLGLDVLREFDGDAKIRAKALVFGAYRLDDADLAIGLLNGVARLDRGKGLAYGGTVDLGGTADFGANRFVAAVSAKGVDLARAAKGFGGGVGAGRLDLFGDFKAEGGSVAELVSTLSGAGGTKAEGVRVGGEGPSAGMAIIAWIPAVFDQLRGLAGGGQAGADAGATNAAANFTIAGGVVAVPDLRIVSDSGEATAAGKVDLPRWRLDLEGDVKPSPNLVSALLSGTTGIEISVPLKVDGPIDKPRSVLDLQRLPGNVLRLPGQLLKRLIK